MDKLEKGYKLGITKKFDDGAIVSVEFFSRVSDSAENITPEKLFELVYNSTMDDVKATVSRDPVAKSLWNNIKACIQKEIKAEKLLEETKKRKEKNADTNN